MFNAVDTQTPLYKARIPQGLKMKKLIPILVTLGSA